jgi:hypothetical protein
LDTYGSFGKILYDFNYLEPELAQKFRLRQNVAAPAPQHCMQVAIVKGTLLRNLFILLLFSKQLLIA